MRLRSAGSLVLAALALVACSESHSPGEADGGARDGGARVDAGDAGLVSGDECTMPSDCVVVPASCCGSCGAATRGDAIAIHRDRAAEHRASACGDDVGCPPCFSPPDPTLVATCGAGRCVLVDLQAHPATECTSASDCRVRAVECCECGATIEPWTVVAVSDASAFATLVCDPGTGCPECAPVYPDTFGATCDDGHCSLVVSGAP